MVSSVFDDTSSRESTSDDSSNMADFLPSTFPITSTFEYVVNHVFLPICLPKNNDYSSNNAHTLARAVHAAARAYTQRIDDVHKPYWLHVTEMLENLQVFFKPHTPSLELHRAMELSRADVALQLGQMSVGDILTFPNRLHDEIREVVLWKQDHCILCRLLRSFSQVEEGKGVVNIKIPNETFGDEDFQSKLANFLSPITNQVPTGMSLGMDSRVELEHLTKSSWINPEWSRSGLWFFIRLAIKLSLGSSLGHGAYKTFMLFFMCNLANYADNIYLSSTLLHSMSVKILRRFRKLGSSVPQWLCDTVLHTCSNLSWTLDERRKRAQAIRWQRLSSPWNPSRLDLAKDIQPSLPRLHDYISRVSLAKHEHGCDLQNVPFLSNSHLRGTLNDLLSKLNNFPSRSAGIPVTHHDDTHVTLYEVEQAVEEGIDDWLASVTDVDEACKQLGSLLNQLYASLSLVIPSDPSHVSLPLDTPSTSCRTSESYDSMPELQSVSESSPDETRSSNPDQSSIILLTMMELWVALDKLVVKEFPILLKYSPEISLSLLSRLHLRDAVDMHRFFRVYQYVFARHAQAHRGWSVLSDSFTEHSFPCCYYDSSPHLQRLKASIEKTLPADPLHAKVVVFELQCPLSFDTWRSVTCTLARYYCKPDKKGIQVRAIPQLKAYILGNRKWPYSLYLSRSVWDKFYYLYEGLSLGEHQLDYDLPSGPYVHSQLQQYLRNTTHTSNKVLAAQMHYDPSVSLHEFFAFAHLRSGGSLQWLNILRELRSRTLEFRHQEIFLLFAQASAQAGPLDSTGELLWHQEVQDVSFCHALLEELESLFVDIGVGSLDGPAMATISLLAGILTSRSPGATSQRAIQLLQNVRKKTYGWVHELLYDVRKAPVNKKSLELLRDMAAICRSTFDVGSTMSHKLLCSTHDIEAALSCAMLIRTLVHSPSFTASDAPDDTTIFDVPKPDVSAFSRVLLDRDRRLAYVLGGSLKNAIQGDGSDLGVDRAVQMVWPDYRPGPRRWEPLHTPNSAWLVCETAPTTQSQMVHVNLLDGSLLVDGKLMGGGLPNEVIIDSMYRELFGDCDLMVVASDLPGMDFVTISAVHKHRVHFAVRNNNLASRSWHTVVIRAQSEDMDNIFELIPREQMSLPAPLVEGHVHWLNISTSIIEIRSVEQPWKQSPDNWTIHPCPQAGQFRVIKGAEYLVDNQSPTWKMVSRRFSCLDNPRNLIMTVSPVGTTQLPSLRLSVTLPRYGLSFFVNEDNNLESRDFEGMVYDEDQDIGTLCTLVNMLVLRPKAQIEIDHIPKRILIPYINSFKQCGDGVHLNLPSSGPVRYYTYQVDSELGCLKQIVSLESREYLARLHFLTCTEFRPDLLTGRTGVEEAFSLISLDGALCETTEKLSKWFIHLQIYCQDTSGDGSDPFELPNSDAVLQDPYLLPPDVAACLQLPRRGPSESLDQLFHERSAPCLWARNRPPYYDPGRPGLSSPNIDPLRQLLSSLRINETAPPFQSQYLSRLHKSADSFRRIGVNFRSDGRKPSIETLRAHYAQCRINYTESYNLIKMVLEPKTEFEQLLDQCGQWPRVTPFILFRCLAFTSSIKPPEIWKKCLISLALLAIDLQRARRLLRFALDGLEEELFKELENDGCDERDLVKYPDWLLIQLQGNFLIRHVQAEVAKEMMTPRSGKNTIMQVNMGEGKTSVIIPICAAALADGNKLVRIIVPKPLVPQTLQLLTDRLGGLVNKPVHHLFFHRNLGVTKRTPLDRYIHLRSMSLDERVRKCWDKCGIIVMQPEEVLSLKLATVERQLIKNGIQTNATPTVQEWGSEHVLDALKGFAMKSLTRNSYVSAMIERVKRWRREPEASDSAEPIDRELAEDFSSVIRAENLLKVQRFLETHVRDMLDESDDVLRPQSQVIYAIGHRQPFAGSPDRWITIQEVLGLVKRHAYFLSTSDSDAIRCDGSVRSGSFPHVHILQVRAGEELISLIAHDVLEGYLPGLSFHSEPGLTGAIRKFILSKDIHQDTIKTVKKYARQSTIWGSLLLLRGLLAHNILLFSLTQRRWRVDYGLDPTRTMLAIPYRAKDVPAATAEFGHPDIIILLTCLSYYYEGLNDNQLRISFELLQQQDVPSSEYALWLEDYDIASVPIPLRKLSGVNIRSLEQWDNILFPLFTRNKRAIDLYLSKVVFTKHAKEFPRKISSSCWDVAEQRSHLVTGFSGTNDGQYLLPTSITQDDPDYLHQTGINAEVLSYLLQPENSSYMMMTTDKNGERWTRELLETIVAQHPKIRVLLDVGAQILDLSNRELAKAWLDYTPGTEVAGAIYFSDWDELMVLTRNGVTECLSSSPLAQQLHRCVTYLDDAHTRGTDLKFPHDFRAAVTLGHKVTKDRLVQGCMRMRKLGHGHSVMFFAYHEVDQSIRGLVGKENQSIPLTTADILHWAIHETWSEIRRHAPCWAQQGLDHQSRYEAWSLYGHGTVTPKQLEDAWVQPERKSLDDMYMPRHSPDTTSSVKLPRQIQDRCANLGIVSLLDDCMNEEQEREVSREIEREIEPRAKWPPALPATHSLHPDVILFVRTGVVPSLFWSSAFRHVFSRGVTAGSGGAHGWSSSILATADFCETTKESESLQGRVNDYPRPVQWVLSGKPGGRDVLVLLSPFEADCLMPEIRVSKHVHLHLYIPRTTKRMKPSDDLRLYSIPPVPDDWIPPWDLIDQLNVFAGQLYLSDFTSYVRLCRFLGVHTEGIPQNTRTVDVRNWFNWFSDSEETNEEIENRFKGTRLPLAMQLLAIRNGLGFTDTHMGKIINGWPLTEEDFQVRHQE